jgi:SPX domain protein involved in polyphosphate accumulation
MKFGKLYEFNLIKDWKEEYLDYEILKQGIKEIRNRFLKSNPIIFPQSFLKLNNDIYFFIFRRSIVSKI